MFQPITVCVSIHPKGFDEVEVRALCRPVKLFPSKLEKPFLNEQGSLMLKQGRKGPSKCHKVGFKLLSKICLMMSQGKTKKNRPKPKVCGGGCLDTSGHKVYPHGLIPLEECSFVILVNQLLRISFCFCKKMTGLQGTDKCSQ